MAVTDPLERGTQPADRALRVTVPGEWADIVGALLIDRLGPYEDVDAGGGSRTLVFYPDAQAAGRVDRRTVDHLLPADPALRERVSVGWDRVPRDWVDGWRRHFHPLTVRGLYLRPPWEPPPAAGLVDVVINPGLAFGTGLHPTTRGVLALLQEDAPPEAEGASPRVDPAAGEPGGVVARGPLEDVGTGSGILAIAAAKLGYAPVRAFDNDPLAVQAATANALANGAVVEVWADDLQEVPLQVFARAVVLANLTEAPVTALLRRLAVSAATGGAGRGEGPHRVIVSGILAGAQEEAVSTVALESGFALMGTFHEGEWVSLDLRPAER